MGKSIKMDVKELRIGNWVLGEEETSAQIISMLLLSTKDYSIGLQEKIEYVSLLQQLNPIPLTEEWLLKFGVSEYIDLHGNPSIWSIEIKHMNQDYGTHEHLCLGMSHEDFDSKDWDCWLWWIGTPDDGATYNYDIKYIHQLQNLYFALTGEELTIKES